METQPVLSTAVPQETEKLLNPPSIFENQQKLESYQPLLPRTGSPEAIPLPQPTVIRQSPGQEIPGMNQALYVAKNEDQALLLHQAGVQKNAPTDSSLEPATQQVKNVKGPEATSPYGNSLQTKTDAEFGPEAVKHHDIQQRLAEQNSDKQTSSPEIMGIREGVPSYSNPEHSLEKMNNLNEAEKTNLQGSSLETKSRGSEFGSAQQGEGLQPEADFNSSQQILSAENMGIHTNTSSHSYPEANLKMLDNLNAAEKPSLPGNSLMKTNADFEIGRQNQENLSNKNRQNMPGPVTNHDAAATILTSDNGPIARGFLSQGER